MINLVGGVVIFGALAFVTAYEGVNPLLVIGGLATTMLVGRLLGL
jgi:hypothetical protein